MLNIIHISQYLHFQMSVCDNIMNTNCELNKMGVSYSKTEKRYWLHGARSNTLHVLNKKSSGFEMFSFRTQNE